MKKHTYTLIIPISKKKSSSDHFVLTKYTRLRYNSKSMKIKNEKEKNLDTYMRICDDLKKIHKRNQKIKAKKKKQTNFDKKRYENQEINSYLYSLSSNEFFLSY